jgi:methylphosphotriester-DNA--protein-cysteine methyltransferase
MRIVAPSAALAPFVRQFMLVEVGDTTVRLRLPEPGFVLGVRYRGQASVLVADAELLIPQVSLAGLTDTARRMRTEAGGGVLLASFHPGGAAPFFPHPLHEFFGATVALEQILPRREVARVHAQVGEAAGDRERVAALEAYLLGRLTSPRADPVVAAALRAITETRGALQIRPLARKLGISQDPLEKRFRRAVGASPKRFASLLRLRHAIDAYRPGASLAQLAQAAGYFDQSHFSRAFQAVTGLPPGRFFRAGEHP